MLACQQVAANIPFRFSLDTSLGRLARWLRLLGHDASWQRGDSLADALVRARTERRALLTRRRDFRRLGLQWPPDGGLVIRTDGVDDQMVEVARRWPIFSISLPFSRCPLCGGRLGAMSPGDARPRVPEFVADTQPSFHICPTCDRVFWRATHAEQILDRFRRLAGRAGQTFPVLEDGMKEGAEPDSTDPAPPQR
jgi:uncharacterized protein with PIN domain